MKLLRDILYRVSLENVIGQTNMAIENICFDSRKVGKFSAFIAIEGTQSDGHEFIDKAIDKGAVAIVCNTLPDNLDPKVTYVEVDDTAKALGFLASNFYDNPSDEIKLVGVTGTNGKTTIVSLLYELFKELGYHVGLLSTVVYKIDTHEIPATHTTPDPIAINSYLRQMINNGCSHCFMEVSSHAVAQHRIAGLSFDGGIFTNITHDHLDYHKTFDEYIRAKKAFFDGLPRSAFALVNKDDRNTSVMTAHTKARIKTFALKNMADFKCKILENQFSGMLLNINNKEVWTKLIGKFNAYNLLSVFATTSLMGENEMDVLTAISNLETVDGRFQYIKNNKDITAIVDYAHTPDALENVLETIKDLRTGNEQLITVVGCGGDRDKDKRPLMAKTASEYSDKVVLTSDNPRNESPENIIEDMIKGLDPTDEKKVLSIVNRKEAIRTACSLASKGDIILVAGKGHEKYQEIKGKKTPFDDYKILETTLKTTT